jgi:hypothetical protein
MGESFKEAAGRRRGLTAPKSPGAWIRWSVETLERFGRPRAVRYDFSGRSDPRLDDRREAALSVLRILERITGGNGAGRLLAGYYIGEKSWFEHSEADKRTIGRTARRFAEELRRAGLLTEDGGEHGGAI